MDEIGVQTRELILRMSLLSYGATMRYGDRRGGDSEHVGPPGEPLPMAEQWARMFDAAPNRETLRQWLEAARAEFDAYIRRPLAPDTVETLEELCERIVRDGWGITAEECALAMRCTPTLARRARLEALRNPETGYPLPERTADPHAWLIALDRAGLSVRQIEALTGVPKSSVHDRLLRRRRVA
jgi:hypothetical protein